MKLSKASLRNAKQHASMHIYELKENERGNEKKRKRKGFLEKCTATFGSQTLADHLRRD
jgi:hypothetical protein